MRQPRRNHSSTFKAKEAVNVKELRAKIGSQALEIDFLAGALGRLPGSSAKRAPVVGGIQGLAPAGCGSAGGLKVLSAMCSRIRLTPAAARESGISCFGAPMNLPAATVDYSSGECKIRRLE